MLPEDEALMKLWRLNDGYRDEDLIAAVPKLLRRIEALRKEMSLHTIGPNGCYDCHKLLEADAKAAKEMNK